MRPRDLVALTKPRITAMAVAVAVAASWLAPEPLEPVRVGLAWLGIGLIVAAANAFNQYLERDVDALMQRTRGRPMPGGRVSPRMGLAVAIVLSLAAFALLLASAGPLTAALGAGAWVNYVFAYTPLKRRTTWALPVGSVSGAMPVLLGWTAVTDRLDPMGLALFGVFFVWQIPHFIAISIYRRSEYEAAGIRIVTAERGVDVAKRQALAYTTALVPLSLATWMLHGEAGPLYLLVVVLANAGFVGLGVAGLGRDAGAAWARRFFAASLVYPLALLAGLLLDLAV